MKKKKTFRIPRFVVGYYVEPWGECWGIIDMRKRIVANFGNSETSYDMASVAKKLNNGKPVSGYLWSKPSGSLIIKHALS